MLGLGGAVGGFRLLDPLLCWLTSPQGHQGCGGVGAWGRVTPEHFQKDSCSGDGLAMWEVVDWPVSSEKTRGPSCVVGAAAPRSSRHMRPGLATPPVPPSGTLEEAPDFTASVSHGRKQMGQGQP